MGFQVFKTKKKGKSKKISLDWCLKHIRLDDKCHTAGTFSLSALLKKKSGMESFFVTFLRNVSITKLKMILLPPLLLHPWENSTWCKTCHANADFYTAPYTLLHFLYSDSKFKKWTTAIQVISLSYSLFFTSPNSTVGTHQTRSSRRLITPPSEKVNPLCKMRKIFFLLQFP